MHTWVDLPLSGSLFESGPATPLGRITRAGRHLNRRVSTPTPMRYWDIYSAVYVLKGHAKYHNQDGLSQDIGSGDLILMFPRHGYRYVVDPHERWSEFFVHFRGPLFRLWMKEGLLDPRRPICHLEPMDHWWKRLEAMVAPMGLPEPAQSLKRVCLLQHLLVDAVIAPQNPLPSDHARWLAQAQSALEENMGRPFEWDAVSHRLGLSKRQFRRRFTEWSGVTPARYRAAKVIEHAEHLLTNRNQPIKDIAFTCGFCDEFHFGKRFKALTGLTPLQFRQRMM